VDPVVLLGAFVAGVLTTLAPCVLPLLPVIVGGSVSSGSSVDAGGGSAALATRPKVSPATRRALIVTGSLAVSVLGFTLLLRASTALLGIPPTVWSWVSGGILVALGAAMLFPTAWDTVSGRLGLQGRSTARLQAAADRDGTTGAVLTGAALGPVFSSCSPLYAYVLVTVLPANPVDGLVLLTVYVLGLAGALLVVALAGQRVIAHLGWAADPHGRFRRGLGLAFVLVGVAVALGWDRDLQSWILEHSPVQPWNLDSGFVPEGSA
jgi:cytochrome c-type biogenesis protein